MRFEQVKLPAEEKESFIKYMEHRGLSPTTIKSVLNYLSATYALTKHTRRKARYARRVYKDFKQAVAEGRYDEEDT